MAKALTPPQIRDNLRAMGLLDEMGRMNYTGYECLNALVKASKRKQSGFSRFVMTQPCNFIIWATGEVTPHTILLRRISKVIGIKFVFCRPELQRNPFTPTFEASISGLKAAMKHYRLDDIEFLRELVPNKQVEYKRINCIHLAWGTFKAAEELGYSRGVNVQTLRGFLKGRMGARFGLKVDQWQCLAYALECVFELPIPTQDEGDD